MGNAEIIATIQTVGYAIQVISEMVAVAQRTIEILQNAHGRDLTPDEITEVKARRDAANLRLKKAVEAMEALNSQVR
jgi:hypothetical protein